MVLQNLGVKDLAIFACVSSLCCDLAGAALLPILSEIDKYLIFYLLSVRLCVGEGG